MNIVIYTQDFGWAGGIDFLDCLVKGLLAQRKVKVNIFLLIKDSSKKIPFGLRLLTISKKILKLLRNPLIYIKKFLSAKESLEVTKSNFENTSYLNELFINENVKIVYYSDITFKSKEKILKSIRADVVLPVMNKSDRLNKTPWVGYIFDFGYKYHTHLFKSEFCLSTDILFANTLLKAKAIIVNSISVKNDINKFFPYATTKIFVLPFAPFSSENIYKKALINSDILFKYGIKKKYFIISNQFWLHKAHEIAFRALSILNSNNNLDVSIVCTGTMTDLSGTNHRKVELEIYINELGLKDNILFLGHLSKVDQLSLMQNSQGVIQPTTFEGGPGGGAVYMALGNGIPSIVSDIDVNKEIINDRLVSFFKVNDPFDLANKMKEYLQRDFKLLNFESIEKQNIERLELLGETLIESINYVRKV